MLEAEINTALQKFQRAAKLVPMGPNEGPFRLATASESPVTSFDMNSQTSSERTRAGAAEWTLRANVKSEEGGYICDYFLVRVTQDRNYLLLFPPRVLVVQFSSLHPSVSFLLDQVFKEHSIDFTRTNAVH